MILIGEKLNGAIPRVREAIAAGDEAFLTERVRLQAEAGADYIDVCAGTAEGSDGRTLEWLIAIAQRACDTPLCLDSPSAEQLRDAMPLCARPGILNSASMEAGKADLLFPLIAGTDWRCVALLCDDGGVPESAGARLAIAEMLLKKASDYGLREEQLFLDPLVTTLAANEQAMTVFLETVRGLRANWPKVHITSGLSNISFGLPARKQLNRAFLILAMGAGMDSAILDVCDRELIGAVLAANALLEKDEYCMDYIGAYREGRIG